MIFYNIFQFTRCVMFVYATYKFFLGEDELNKRIFYGIWALLIKWQRYEVYMKVIIGQSAYEMTSQQLVELLKVASKQVPFGIYAVKKGKICELHNDKFDSKEDLLANVEKYSMKGFKVYYNAPQTTQNDRRAIFI